MNDSDQSVIAANTATQSTQWKDFWLLSYVSPFVLLSVILMLCGEVKGYLAAVALIGPFGLGIIGTICSLAFSRLPLWRSSLCFLLTIIGYVVGLVIFCFLIALVFGVVAT